MNIFTIQLNKVLENKNIKGNKTKREKNMNEGVKNHDTTILSPTHNQ